MCGFAGILSWGTPLSGSTTPLLASMGQQLMHRGPDDSQTFIQDRVGIVFRRLSIVDLEGGQQPFVSEDGKVIMVVNGEIYNHQELRGHLRESHQFQSQSDGEVLLHLYEEQGISMLDAVNGMFSVLLYDQRRQVVHLIRDRLGIKPLYYCAIPEGLLVASEMKALWAHPQCPIEVDWVAHWAHKGFTYSENLPTFFVGIEQVPGGSIYSWSVQNGAHTQQTYWTATAQSGKEGLSLEEISEEYVALLEDAVQLRLMADVEVGVFLSGGIDSVSIAHFAKNHQPLHTFSVLSQSTFTNGDAEMAHRSAAHLGLPNHQVLYPHHGLPVSAQDWKHILWHCELPDCEIEQLYKFFLHRYAKATRPDLKVILLGQGSDEWNGGYSLYLAKVQARRYGMPENWETFMSYLKKKQKENFMRLGHQPGFQNSWPLFQSEFLATHAPQLTHAQNPWHFYWQRSRYNLQQFNLWHEDRTSMANYIESRVPFLDHRLIDFTLQVPTSMYSRAFWDKNILRHGLQKHLPDSLAKRPKGLFYHGNDVRYSNRMMHSLFAENNAALLQEALEGSTKVAQILDRDEVVKAFRAIEQDPERTGIRALLPTLNMGLLQSMAEQAQQGTPSPSLNEKLSLSSIPISNWEESHEKVSLTLALTRESVTENAVLKYPAGVFLLQVAQHPHIWKIEMDGELEFYLNEKELSHWVPFLKLVDGKRTIQELLDALDFTMGMIRKSLEEAMEYGVLEAIAEPPQVSSTE